MTTPTKRTMDYLRANGADLVAVVEKWNPVCKIRNDLFGFVDVLAIQGSETIAVQTTSYSNVSARIHKIEESPALPFLRAAGWRILVHGWHKVDNRWKVRVVDVS